MATRHWFSTTITGIDHERLMNEVIAAGYSCDGTANDLTHRSRVGLDLALETLTGPQQTQLQNIVNGHDGTLTSRLAAATIQSRAAMRAQFKLNAGAIRRKHADNDVRALAAMVEQLVDWIDELSKD